MKRLVFLGAMALGACESTPTEGMQEFMVIGGRMTFEDCRARGGLIIRDSNTNMVACDPSVRRAPAPADEFDNPTSNPVG
ncbi:MAG: hypothetical protein AAFU41_18870 [Pseudomonadota bacterium]